MDAGEDLDVIDDSEPLERHEEGLYYPVCIGQVLARRHRIEHKLGLGGGASPPSGWPTICSIERILLRASRLQCSSSPYLGATQSQPLPRLRSRKIASGHSFERRGAAAPSTERPLRCRPCASRYVFTHNPRSGFHLHFQTRC